MTVASLFRILLLAALQKLTRLRFPRPNVGEGSGDEGATTRLDFRKRSETFLQNPVRANAQFDLMRRSPTLYLSCL